MLLRNFSSILALSRTVSAECTRPLARGSQKTNCFVWTAYLDARLLSSLHSQPNFDLTDMTSPHTWYPLARKMKRNVVLHVGPTNSGKTYQALKKLVLSSSGVYCGPLRLLAWEVAERLNKANVPCSLITGQEREEIAGAAHSAMTVEMADVTRQYKCAVIDEIQMIGCTTRGFSFTRALLGLAVDELHLCGDPAAVPLIQEMLKVTGDNVEVQYYERLSPLIPLRRPLGSFLEIQRGDCIVAFSRPKIYSIKRQIQSISKHLCSVVYGSLPPETRTRQAAGLFPSFDILALYSRLHPNCTFYSVLEHFVENAKLSSNYFIMNCEAILKVAEAIEDLPLGLEERYLFCISPVEMDDGISAQGLIQFAEEYAKKGLVNLKKVFTPGTLCVPKTQNELKEVESIHKVLCLYIWLSFRLEESFPNRELAYSQKALCGMLIEEYLERLGYRKPDIRRGIQESNISLKGIEAF